MKKRKILLSLWVTVVFLSAAFLSSARTGVGVQSPASQPPAASAQTQAQAQAQPQAPGLRGEKALEFVKAQVAFGPRPPGSAALEKCRDWIKSRLQGFGYQVEDDAFDAKTPRGPVRMHNLIARKGQGGKAVVALASHYDTKLMQGIRFVGANDAGSSTGLLLELARVLAGGKRDLDVWFVFLDGEEAFVEWSDVDGTYGSRHLAERWSQEGVAGRIRALILLDMIGDKNLDLYKEMNSSRWLSDLFWRTAVEIGLRDILSNYAAAMEDDHIPFLRAGIDSLDLIDFNYGPENSFWHTDADTLDKLSPESMEKVGRLVLAGLAKLETKFSR
jgi:Peptidase family M28